MNDNHNFDNEMLKDLITSFGGTVVDSDEERPKKKNKRNIKLEYSQNKRHFGNGYSIAIPDGFTKENNYKSPSGDIREFIAYLPSLNTGEEAMAISFYPARELPFNSIKAKDLKFYSPVAEDYVFRFEQMLAAKTMTQAGSNIECYPIRTENGSGYVMLLDNTFMDTGYYFFYVNVPVKENAVMFRVDIIPEVVEDKDEAKIIVETIISKLSHEYLVEEYKKLDDDYYTKGILTEEKTDSFIKTCNDLISLSLGYLNTFFNQIVDGQMELDINSGKVSRSQSSVNYAIKKHINKYLDDEIRILNEANRQLTGFFNKASEINKDNILIYEIKREILEYLKNTEVSMLFNDEEIKKQIPSVNNLSIAVNNHYLENQDLTNEASQKPGRTLNINTVMAEEEKKRTEEINRKARAEELEQIKKQEKERKKEELRRKASEGKQKRDNLYRELEDKLNKAVDKYDSYIDNEDSIYVKKELIDYKDTYIEEQKQKINEYLDKKFSTPVYDLKEDQLDKEALKEEICDFTAYENVTVKEVADHFRLSTQVVTPLLNELTSEGYVTKRVERRVAYYSINNSYKKKANTNSSKLLGYEENINFKREFGGFPNVDKLYQKIKETVIEKQEEETKQKEVESIEYYKDSTKQLKGKKSNVIEVEKVDSKKKPIGFVIGIIIFFVFFLIIGFLTDDKIFIICGGVGLVSLAMLAKTIIKNGEE